MACGPWEGLAATGVWLCCCVRVGVGSMRVAGRHRGVGVWMWRRRQGGKTFRRNGARILRPPRQHTMLQTWPQLHPWMSVRTCCARCAQAARLREAFMEQEKTVRERLSTAKQEAAGQVGSRGAGPGWVGT